MSEIEGQGVERTAVVHGAVRDDDPLADGAGGRETPQEAIVMSLDLLQPQSVHSILLCLLRCRFRVVESGRLKVDRLCPVREKQQSTAVKRRFSQIMHL